MLKWRKTMVEKKKKKKKRGMKVKRGRKEKKGRWCLEGLRDQYDGGYLREERVQ